MLAFMLLAVSSAPAWAADEGGNHAAKESAKSGKGEEMKLPPLPAEARARRPPRSTARRSSTRSTVGSLPVRDEKGKKTAEVVFTAYTMAGADRPVTFALNGGPGASSVYLNFGAIGPKHVNFGNEGDSPSDPATLHDNPGTWLDFTDLVFIDPVGTGFSRALVYDKRGHEAVLQHRQPTSSTCRASSTTGWSRTTGCSRASTWSAKATAASAGRASPTTCRPSSAWR